MCMEDSGEISIVCGNKNKRKYVIIHVGEKTHGFNREDDSLQIF